QKAVFLVQNFARPDRFGGRLGSPRRRRHDRLAVGDDGMSISATGTAYIQTPFLEIANIDKLPLITPSQANFSQSQLALGGPGSGGPGSGSGGSNSGKSLEISLMVDITGSMNDGSGSGSTYTTKLQDLKAAATDLINVVIW